MVSQGAAGGFGRGGGRCRRQVAILLLHQRHGLAADLLQARLYLLRENRQAGIHLLAGNRPAQFLVRLRHQRGLLSRLLQARRLAGDSAVLRSSDSDFCKLAACWLNACWYA